MAKKRRRSGTASGTTDETAGPPAPAAAAAEEGGGGPAAGTTTRKKRSTKRTAGGAGSRGAGAGGKGGAPNRQMTINYVPGEECRVALVEDGRLEEFHAERAGAVTIVGNIYVGKVVNVESAIQAAFIDFGREANGFLHVSDLHPRYFPGETDETTERIGHKTPRRERPPIQQCLRRGQEVIVQVLKEGISTKGPTLTSYLSIPGRYLVMLPDMDRVGVSRKVEDEQERREIKAVLDGLELPPEFGFIARTAGIGKTKAELKRDLAYLQRLWKDLERRRSSGKGPRLLYAESDLLMRALRDYWTSEIDEIIIDDESALKRAARFMRIVAPRTSTRLLRYDRAAPVFHAFGIEEQIRRMHEREVPLPSGGSLVIDETEAMIAIDVNSGRMRNHGDAETTAYKTNVEAVDEICRQLRLRDIGGLVVCDLIDMAKRSNRRSIETLIRDRLKRDRAATRPLPISQFGIVEMTRQRVRGSLKSQHYTRCPMCEGRGVLRRPGSAVADALRELAAILSRDRVGKVELVVSPRLAGELLSARRQTLTRYELTSGKSVDVRVSDDIPVDRVEFYAYDTGGADLSLAKLTALRPPRDLEEIGTASPSKSADDDWAVDTQAEEAPIPEIATRPEDDELAGPTPGLDLDDDPLLAEPDDDDDRAASEQPDAGKKRRRRRGGRRRRSGAGQADERDEHAGEDRGERGRSGDEEGRDREDAEDGEQSTGRRRRRKRGGRRRRGESEAGQDARSERDDELDTERGGEREPAGHGLRGDSWDLEPSALTPAAPAEPDEEDDDASPDDNGAPAGLVGEPSAASAAGLTDDRAPRKAGRSRVRKSERITVDRTPAVPQPEHAPEGGAADDGASAASRGDSWDLEPSAVTPATHDSAAGTDEASGEREPEAKKPRRKAAGRKKTSKKAGLAKPADDGSDADAPDAKLAKKTRSKARGRAATTKPKDAPAELAEGPGNESTPAPENGKAKPARKKRASKGRSSSAAPAVEPKTPPRPLFASRRRT